MVDVVAEHGDPSTLELTAQPATRPEGGVPTLFLLLAFAAGGVLVALAEHLAADGDKSLHFYLFWSAYSAVLLPVGWVLVRSSTRDHYRGPLVVALAVWSLLPVWMRTGDRPLYFDEFSHLRLLQDLLRVGHPVPEPALLQIGSSFPGLEMVTGALVRVSGLDPWGAAMVVAAVSHVAILAGVFVLVSDIAASKRAGALAALVYSLNPSWLFFDAQFAYETLALPFLLWGLVFAMRAIGTSSRTPHRSTVWTCVGLSFLFSASLVVTHHVTSVFNCVVLVVLAAVVTLRNRGASWSIGESPRTAWLLATWSVAVTTARFLAIGHPLAVYLSPVLKVGNEFRQLVSLLGLASSLPVREAFGNSGLPFVEVACGYLLPPVLLVAFAWAAWGLFSKRKVLSSFVYVCVLAGLGYFASLPLLTAREFSEAVHRSWAFSYIGLATVIGLAVDRALRSELNVSLKARHAAWWPRTRARWTRIGATFMFAVAAIGGVATGSAAAYRFGEPVHFGEDAAANGTQTSLVASWFHAHGLPGQRVFADRYVSDPIAADSDISVVNPGTFWGITFDSSVTSQLSSQFATITYIVVDRRMGSGKPSQGYWYTPSEPHAFANQLIPRANVLRFQCFNWLHAVYATSDYEVLLVDPSQLKADSTRGTNGLDASCMLRLKRL